MRGIIGLELVAIGKKESFEIYYENGKYYRKGTNVPVEGLIDNLCFFCGTSYYTLEDQEIEFCPNCGKFEKAEFKRLDEVFEWSRAQDFSFLKFNGLRCFAVDVKGIYELRFAVDREDLFDKYGFEDGYLLA